MHEYTFEIKATQVITVRATDEQAARAFVTGDLGDSHTRIDYLHALDAQPGLIDDYLTWEDGEPYLADIDIDVLSINSPY